MAHETCLIGKSGFRIRNTCFQDLKRAAEIFAPGLSVDDICLMRDRVGFQRFVKIEGIRSLKADVE